jgi:branched-chain amino acid transport system permease protein
MSWIPPRIRDSWLLYGLIGGVTIVAPLGVGTLILLAIGDASLLRTATVFFITLSAVVGFQIFSGNSGVLSFGHVAFMGFAAYMSSLLTMTPFDKRLVLQGTPAWLTRMHFDFWAAALITLLAVALLAVVIGVPMVRLSGSAAAIATLGLLVITNVVLVGARSFTNGASVFFGVPETTTLALAFTWATVAILIARLFRESVVGLRLRATREDELAARSSAINVSAHRLVAWVIAAVVVAGAGILLAHYLTAFSPREFYLTTTFNILAMLIVGGSGSVSGAVIGAVTLTVAFEFLRRIEEGLVLGPIALQPVFGLTGLFVGVLILLIMFRRREGVVGPVELDERWGMGKRSRPPSGRSSA